MSNPVIVQIHETLRQHRDSLDRVELAVAHNTDITEEIHEWMRLAKGGLRVLGGLGKVMQWIGWIAAGVAGVVALMKGHR
jgi:hypothetical protein